MKVIRDGGGAAPVHWCSFFRKTESGSNPFRYGTYRISGLMFEAEVVRDGQNDVIRS